MKKIILLLVIFSLAIGLFAQNREEAEKIVNEGIAFHDRGDFLAAIAKYDKALELDKDNLLALAEKAYSSLSLGRHEDAIAICKHAIETHPGDENLQSIYVTYGNALDGFKQTDKAVMIYDEGISKFPGYYQLHFNKGIALATSGKYDDALPAFHESIILRPSHPGSNNAIARILYDQKKTVPSIMAFTRFLVVEPQGNRAKDNLQLLQKLMNGNATKTGENSISINIDSDQLPGKKGKKKGENDFSQVDLVHSLSAALDYDEKYAKQTEVEKFNRKFETICDMLKEIEKDNSGFYWKYYAAYFIEMRDKKLLETLGYLVFASSGDKQVKTWLDDNKEAIEKFYAWNDSYKFKGR